MEVAIDKKTRETPWGIIAPAITFCYLLLLIILKPFQIHLRKKEPENVTPLMLADNNMKLSQTP
jgi:hypothetical protein